MLGDREPPVAWLKPLLERLASTGPFVDVIVYRLYGLTGEEVAIVEGSWSGSKRSDA